MKLFAESETKKIKSTSYEPELIAQYEPTSFIHKRFKSAYLDVYIEILQAKTILKKIKDLEKEGPQIDTNDIRFQFQFLPLTFLPWKKVFRIHHLQLNFMNMKI